MGADYREGDVPASPSEQAEISEPASKGGEMPAFFPHTRLKPNHCRVATVSW